MRFSQRLSFAGCAPPASQAFPSHHALALLQEELTKLARLCYSLGPTAQAPANRRSEGILFNKGVKEIPLRRPTATRPHHLYLQRWVRQRESSVRRLREVCLDPRFEIIRLYNASIPAESPIGDLWLAAEKVQPIPSREIASQVQLRSVRSCKAGVLREPCGAVCAPQCSHCREKA